MTMLYSTQGTITFPIKAGNTLKIKNISGTETVSGSTASREDASLSIGSGYVVYGPQASDATLSLSTSGQVDYEIVAGDVTPSTSALIQVNQFGQGVVDSNLKVAISNSAGAFLNFKKSNTPVLRAGLAGAFANDFRTLIIAAGDSSFSGSYADNNALVNCRHRAWPKFLCDMLTNAGYTADENWVMSAGAAAAPGLTTLAALAAYDIRFSYGTSPTFLNNYPGLGGQYGAHLGTDAVNGWVKNTARKAFDTVDTLMMRASGTGTIDVLDQADVVAGTVNTTGANGALFSTTTLPANSTAVKLRSKGTNCVWYGMGTRVAAKPGIEFCNAGIHGISLAYFNTDPNQGGINFAGPRNSMNAMFTAATKNILMLPLDYNGVNSSGLTLEQAKQGLRNLVATARAFTNPPEIYIVGYTNLVAGPAGLNFDTFMDSMINVAINELDLPVIDQRPLMFSSADAKNYGLMAVDGLHNRAGGQAMTAKLVFDAFMYARTF
ncbi:MAG: hypothetical protein ACM3VZ_11340 [Acidobacteriota bacterium]